MDKQIKDDIKWFLENENTMNKDDKQAFLEMVTGRAKSLGASEALRELGEAIKRATTQTPAHRYSYCWRCGDQRKLTKLDDSGELMPEIIPNGITTFDGKAYSTFGDHMCPDGEMGTYVDRPLDKENK